MDVPLTTGVPDRVSGMVPRAVPKTPPLRVVVLAITRSGLLARVTRLLKIMAPPARATGWLLLLTVTALGKVMALAVWKTPVVKVSVPEPSAEAEVTARVPRTLAAAPLTAFRVAPPE